LPATIEWLTDNGSGYIAHDTKRFARDIGFEPRTTPVESPQSNGMAEAFVRTMKRDYARVSQLPDAAAVIRQLPAWFEHYNTVHPHRALSYRSPREFIASRSNRENSPILEGQQHIQSVAEPNWAGCIVAYRKRHATSFQRMK
jgi:putative transposase